MAADDVILGELTAMAKRPKTTKSDDDGRPSVLKRITNWTAGLSALLIALAGLWSAAKQIPFFAEEQQLPTRYGKPRGFIERHDGSWYETDEGTGAEFVFEEVSRKAGRTVVYDGSRDLYLRWPTGGGTVQWSKSNPLAWKDLYVVRPVPSRDDKETN